MGRFVGVKNNKIYVISDKPFAPNGFQVIEVPSELETVSASDLIVDYKIKDNKIVSKKLHKPANQIRLALVGNWKMRCGISTYSENLWPQIVKHVGDFKLFIEENELPTGPFNLVGDQTIPEDKVQVCWKRGESNKELVKAIKEYNPDIVLIQHEFGLFPNAGRWLALMNQLSEFRVIVTMHSVFHHKDKTICEAAIPEIVVHLDGAKKVLKEEKQIPGKVHVIPHGCYPCLTREKLWNLYKSERTFTQFGFGFRYKGWENSIRAVAILKEKYNDIFFTGLFSESPYAKVEHQIYYNELMDLVSQLGIEENVAIIRGYQSDASLDAYLRTNRATVFPYVATPEHEVFGASGAARMAMAKGAPVITSSVNHFSDLPTIKADGPEEIAKALDFLFADWKNRDAQIKKQMQYIEENTWENVAKMYINAFENG